MRLLLIAALLSVSIVYADDHGKEADHAETTAANLPEDKLAGLCTYLEEYKRNPDTASPWLCVAVFDDFVEDKSMALVRGDFTPNLSKVEGELTSRLILHGYFDDEGYEFVEAFNKTPESFDYNKFIEFFKKAHGHLVEDSEARAAAALAEDISGQVSA